MCLITVALVVAGGLALTVWAAGSAMGFAMGFALGAARIAEKRTAKATRFEAEKCIVMVIELEDRNRTCWWEMNLLVVMELVDSKGTS